jgi:hypothetical protein
MIRILLMNFLTVGRFHPLRHRMQYHRHRHHDKLHYLRLGLRVQVGVPHGLRMPVLSAGCESKNQWRKEITLVYEPNARPKMQGYLLMKLGRLGELRMPPLVIATYLKILEQTDRLFSLEISDEH